MVASTQGQNCSCTSRHWHHPAEKNTDGQYDKRHERRSDHHSKPGRNYVAERRKSKGNRQQSSEVHPRVHQQPLGSTHGACVGKGCGVFRQADCFLAVPGVGDLRVLGSQLNGHVRVGAGDA